MRQAKGLPAKRDFHFVATPIGGIFARLRQAVGNSNLKYPSCFSFNRPINLIWIELQHNIALIERYQKEKTWDRI